MRGCEEGDVEGDVGDWGREERGRRGEGDVGKLEGCSDDDGVVDVVAVRT